MEQVDRCRKEDIPAVARLHLKVYGNPTDEPSESLESYYEMVVCGNPWCDEEIPSLVYRSEAGDIEGFIGVIVRRVTFNGKSLRMAVPHRLMVAPDCRSSMAAMQIVRRFFDGAQDFSFGDAANDQARKLMEALGATTSYLYSMNWMSLLRPCSYMGSALEKKYPRLKPLVAVFQPACFLVDSILCKMRRKSIRSGQLQRCVTSGIDSQSLLLCITDFSSRSHLHPEYNETDIQWLWNFLSSNVLRGQLQGFEVCNERGDRIGVCLYYLNAKKAMEVMLLRAREDSADMVFNQLLDRALDLGVINVEGRIEPRFLQSISDNNCLFKRRSWAFVQGRDDEVLNAINRGDAMLSAMDAELWLSSPA